MVLLLLIRLVLVRLVLVLLVLVLLVAVLLELVLVMVLVLAGGSGSVGHGAVDTVCVGPGSVLVLVMVEL